MKRLSVTLLLLVLLLLPSVTVAGGLVPCGGPGEEPCQFCHFAIMTNNVLGWFVAITSIIFAIIFVTAGIKLVTSAGNVSAKESAKKMITNAFIGFVIILAAWLLVDFIMRSLLSPDGQAKIGALSCVAQPESLASRLYHPTPDESRGVAYDGSRPTISPALLAALAVLLAPDDKVLVAADANGLDLDQTKNLQALMRVESGGCDDKTSPAGALGCMQIMPETARQYDSSLEGLSDAEVKAKLLGDDDDNAYNIALGAEIYADLYREYDGDERKIFAAYNGGTGANGASVDCPGLMRWECVWDSPGCYGTGDTSCTPNEGYAETRDYVEKVAGVANQLQ